MSLTTVVIIEQQVPYNRTVAIKIAAYIAEAETTLREWIGDAMYNAIAADTTHTYYTRAQRAETLLAEMIALPDLNRRMTEQGGHVKNLGLDQMGNTNLLMSKMELDSYCSNLYHRARRQVSPILLASFNTRRPTYQERL